MFALPDPRSSNDVGATAGPLIGALRALYFSASYPPTYLVAGAINAGCQCADLAAARRLGAVMCVVGTIRDIGEAAGPIVAEQAYSAAAQQSLFAVRDQGGRLVAVSTPEFGAMMAR
jgi:hypothetical protein